jgi:hypothetical protein
MIMAQPQAIGVTHRGPVLRRAHPSSLSG